jgi:serine/threonine protein phosphatase PrpC
VSRSLGDTAAQRIGVICTPECSTVELSSRDKYLILATDGLWDGISSEEVQGICSKSSSVTDCSERLLKAGLAGLQKNQIDDNITNIVISITNGTLQ